MIKLGLYRHFKGGMYRVLGTAEHTETGEQMVIYIALYGDGLMYVRPLIMFMELTQGEKLIPRFERVGN